MKAHPGFKAVASKIEHKEGVSKKAAGRILGSATRNASKAAKKKNPRLKKVKGDSKPMPPYGVAADMRNSINY